MGRFPSVEAFFKYMDLHSHSVPAYTHLLTAFCLHVSLSDVVFSTSLHFHVYAPVTPRSAA